MALHRDIYWVGRQWAVTGFGMQAVDQRLKGAFDIEVARLWEEDWPKRMRGLSWLNVEDFNKALDLARARFPAPPRKKSLPLVESVLELIQPPAQEPAKGGPPRPESGATPAGVAQSGLPEANLPQVSLPDIGLMDGALPPAEPLAMDVPSELPQPKSGPQPLAMRIEGVSAKFLPRWRIRHGTR